MNEVEFRNWLTSKGDSVSGLKRIERELNHREKISSLLGISISFPAVPAFLNESKSSFLYSAVFRAYGLVLFVF